MGKKQKSKERLTILLATSDNYLKDKLLSVLSDKDFPVEVVNTCKEVFETLVDYNFDVVIFDPEIGKLEELDAVQLIKKIRPKTPIIVVSDETSYETGVKIAEMGVYFRMGKPINEKITKELMKNVEKKLRK
ncbi:MAG: response regulator [bacterium]